MNSTFLKTDKLRNKGGILTFLIISLACWVIYFLDTVAFYSGLLENKDVEIPFDSEAYLEDETDNQYDEALRILQEKIK